MEDDTRQRCGVLGMLLDRIIEDIFDSSCSESSSEDEIASDYSDSSNPQENNSEHVSSGLTVNRISYPVAKKRKIFYRYIVPSFLPEEFKDHFMISKETFDFVLSLIRNDLERKTSGAQQLPPEIQLMVTLRKLCTLNSYRIICEEFRIGKTSTTRAVRRVLNALVKHSSTFIVWPKDNRIQDVCRGFQSMSGFPKVVGSLDSTRIKIPEQPSNQYLHPSLPGQHSVHLQAVVDHEGRFTHCFTGSAGSKEKQEGFNNSVLKDFVSNPSEAFPDDCHLVAGPEYDLHEHVMVAYNDTELTAEQKDFNERLNLAHERVIVAFELLKQRFPSLRNKLELFRVDFIPIYIMACCVLHNICLGRKDFFSDTVEVSAEEVPSTPRLTGVVPSVRAVKKRDAICQQIHMSKEKGFVFV